MLQVLITAIIGAALIGFIGWLIVRFVPMSSAGARQAVNIGVVVAIVIWLLYVFFGPNLGLSPVLMR